MSCDVVTSNLPMTYFEEKEEKINDVHNRDDSVDILDQCDASTIINVSLRKKEKNKIVRKRKYESEDSSTASSDIFVPEAELTQESTAAPPVDRVSKVVGWLEHSIFESHEGTDNIEASERLVSDYWLERNSSDPLLDKNIRRVRVFLLEVEPRPGNEPLDLVSGYCHEGCRRFSTYSMIIWSQKDNFNIPLCHNCAKQDIEKELRLMFKFKLNVMDPNGIHAMFNVWKEHGEEFFGCSTEDFIRQRAVREAAVTPLRRNTVANTLDQDYTALLDVNVVCIKDTFFVVNTCLKQPNQFRKTLQVAESSEPTQTK